MNIKSLVLSDIPKGLTDLEKARYIYLKLAIYLSFNTTYQNTSDSNMAKIYTEGANIDVSNFNSNQAICKSWAKIYSELLSDVGIKNKIIVSGHDYVNFEIDEKIWSADATAGSSGIYTDLSRVKYGDNTYNFGISLSQNPDNPQNHIVHSKEQEELLTSIDNKFSFYKERKQQLLLLKEKVKDLNDKNIPLSERLEIFFDAIGVLEKGYYEGKDFVRNLEHRYLKGDIEKLHGVELKRTNDDFSVDIVQCIYVEDEDDYSYFLLAPNTPIIKVEPKEVIKLSVLGYGIDERKIPGIDFPKQFKAGKVSTSIKYKLTHKFVPGTIKEYDVKQSTTLNS